MELRDRILSELQRQSGQLASELARTLETDKREVSRCLNSNLTGQVKQGSDYRWRLVDATLDGKAPPAPPTEIANLCRYYLDCISQDMDEGASVFAKSPKGETGYASLSSFPLNSNLDWCNSPAVGRFIGMARSERGKITVWIGYPVRLREHRTPRWNGFFAEPVMMWPVVLGESSTSAPVVDTKAPTINAKFLRSMAPGDGADLAGESVRLLEELGLNVQTEDVPDVDELVDRLRRIRTEWDWQEPLDSNSCSGPSLAEISATGIYNRAIIVPVKRSPFTQGLEAELKLLSDVSANRLASTSLGHWLASDATLADGSVKDAQPLLEVLPMNTEQRMAVSSALSAWHTVVTGPPGTGKSQVVTNLIVNAAWRGMKVLFASKNNKAVDVVEERVNSLSNRPTLLRLGANEYQAQLSVHLTKLLAGSPGPEIKSNYEAGLLRHQTLAQRLADLDKVQQRTLDSRNEVDRLDIEAGAATEIFGESIAELTTTVRDHADKDLSTLTDAVDGADIGRQSLLVRIFWFAFRASRYRILEQANYSVASSLKALRIDWPRWTEDGGITVWRERISEFRTRLDIIRKAVEYREALQTLQSLPSFETIAAERIRLTAEVSLNSVSLWRDWVEIAPNRLTPPQRKDVADYAAVLELITGTDADKVHSSTKIRARELQKKVTTLFSSWAVTSLSARGRVPWEPGYFDLVILDEASQCDIASALPLLYRAKRSVIIGDPMQLQHITKLTKQRDSELLHTHQLVDSRMSWMYSVNSLFDVASGVVSTDHLINLRDHHRSHADIIGFSNETFYDGRLRVATKYQELRRPSQDQAGIVWQDIVGSVVRPHSGSALNRPEAKSVFDAVFDLLVTRGFTGSVGVVTPFRAQANLLEELLYANAAIEQVRERANLLIETTHKFQGDERDVMFFSPVVSRGITPMSLGYLRNQGNLFNVAITRARGLFHVIGDRTASSICGVDYLEKFCTYVSNLDVSRGESDRIQTHEVTPDYPSVMHPERVSEWERIMYRAMVRAGLKPIPQFSVEQYDLDFALIDGDRKLAIEVDGERYHRSWTGELCLRDQLRNQRLMELGWEVRRFWVYELRDELDSCLGRLIEWMTNANEPGR